MLCNHVCVCIYIYIYNVSMNIYDYTVSITHIMYVEREREQETSHSVFPRKRFPASSKARLFFCQKLLESAKGLASLRWARCLWHGSRHIFEDKYAACQGQVIYHDSQSSDI